MSNFDNFRMQFIISYMAALKKTARVGGLRCAYRLKADKVRKKTDKKPINEIKVFG